MVFRKAEFVTVFSSNTGHDRCENGGDARAQENHQSAAHDIPVTGEESSTSLARKRRFEEIT